ECPHTAALSSREGESERGAGLLSVDCGGGRDVAGREVVAKVAPQLWGSAAVVEREDADSAQVVAIDEVVLGAERSEVVPVQLARALVGDAPPNVEPLLAERVVRVSMYGVRVGRRVRVSLFGRGVQVVLSDDRTRRISVGGDGGDARLSTVVRNTEDDFRCRHSRRVLDRRARVVVEVVGQWSGGP